MTQIDEERTDASFGNKQIKDIVYGYIDIDDIIINTTNIKYYGK